MVFCGKYFFGYGYVIFDLYIELLVDLCLFDVIQEDLILYCELRLNVVMVVYVIYECMDCNIVVFLNKWLDYLRNNIKFDGVVFIDDLLMVGVGVVGGMLSWVDIVY